MQPEISSTEETQGTPETVHLLNTQETEQLGREAIRYISNLGRVCSPSTWSLELPGPGKGTKCMPNHVCAFAKYPRS